MSSFTPTNPQQTQSGYLSFNQMLNPAQTQSTTSSSAMAQPSTKKYVCDIGDCKKGYDRYESLWSHKQSHGMKSPCPFASDGCTSQFSLKRDIGKHVKAIHEKQSYLCDIDGCTKSSARKDNLKNHQKRIHGA